MEELRVITPRPRSGRWLAERYEVSVRSIERDISALQQAGTLTWSESGRTGGYCLDPLTSLPPVNFTPSEAVAMAHALGAMSGAHSSAQRIRRCKNWSRQCQATMSMPRGNWRHVCTCWVATFVNEPTMMPWGNRSLLFRDPDGNLGNLFTPVTDVAIKKYSSDAR